MWENLNFLKIFAKKRKFSILASDSPRHFLRPIPNGFNISLWQYFPWSSRNLSGLKIYWMSHFQYPFHAKIQKGFTEIFLYISNDPYGTKIQWFDFTWNFLGPPRSQHPYEENMCCTWSRILLVWSCRQFLLPVLFIYTLLYSDNFSIKTRSISYLVIMSWGSKWSYVAKSPNLI